MTVTVDSEDWNALSSEEREKIESIIGKNFEGETIAPEAKELESNPCKDACKLAERLAIKECRDLGGIAGELCVIAAKEAGRICRRAC
jgi:hypothetical protein